MEGGRVLLEHWGGPQAANVPTWASIRSRRWQYIEYYVGGRERRAWRELYALERDPWQLRNLLRDRREEVPSERRLGRLHGMLSRLRRCHGRHMSLTDEIAPKP